MICYKDFYFIFVWNVIDWIGKRKFLYDGGGKFFDFYIEDNIKIDEDFFIRIGDDIIVCFLIGIEIIILVGNVNIFWNELFLYKNRLEYC